ncbi:nucleotide exchange factor GrpE [Sandaracinobacter sp. RS1-74]|uniref:nucleotide exchange factor GrpE n=1 Tax=Sandaracinobacteroides sayramensis TaxID=2913411 RepID=UPI001EDB479D|nr:nucleotide exchange factor GrpE [Sandaracinobacteroides sayramensis]MCG2839649.1 nucleotide exchange factor GrpE [Sandaracinobacteroides sayramensis]
MTAETPENGAEISLEDELAAARAEIVALVTERDAERDRALRMAAEAENTRRRLERDKADAVQFAAAGFARDMLTVADNLARALESLPAEAADGLRTGIEATQRELVSIFERHGIKRVPAVGLPLDPNAHQAMVEVEADAEPGTVVSELQPGWTLKERLLRPALVTVAKAKSETAA